MVVFFQVKSMIQNVVASLHIKAFFNFVVGTHNDVNQAYKKWQIFDKERA